MKTLFLMAAVGAMAVTTPALAQGRGNSDHHNRGHGKVSQSKHNDRYDRRDDRRNDRRYDNRNDRRDDRRYDRRAQQRRWDSSRVRYGDGRGYWYDGGYYRDGRYYGSNCPPGLAKKRNGCLPPGQARARWGVGQRLPLSYRDNYIPRQYRNYYTNGNYRYYDGYVYRVDPTTYVIREILRVAF